MSFHQRFVDPANAAGAADDLDGLLRQFFQAQLPDPWPKLRLSDEPPAGVRPGRWTLLRSRLALAASIALLVGGQVLLANSFRGEDMTKATRDQNGPVVGQKGTRPDAPSHRPAPRATRPER
jgi:hypothetical protein